MLPTFAAMEIETRYGLLAVPDTETDIIGRFLVRYGEWGWDEVCFLAEILPEENARVLDVGAFVGTFGLGLAQKRKLGALCFVEANPAVVPLLARNVHRNSPLPAAVVEALVAAPGTLPAAGRMIEAGNFGSISFASALAEDKAEAAPAPERSVTLAELRVEFGDFDLVKLDVEGMELDILRADEEHLARGCTSIWVECNEDPRSLEIAELLLNWNVNIYYFAFPAFNPENMRGDQDPIFPLAYEAGLLAAPKVPPALTDPLRRHRCILGSVHSRDELKKLMWRTPRWGEREWLDAKPEEMAALAGRSLRGEVYDAYLMPGWLGDVSPRGQNCQQTQDIEQRLRKAEVLADEQSRLFTAEQERCKSLEKTLTEIEAHTLAQLNAAEVACAAADKRVSVGVKMPAAERGRRERVEAALARSTAQALDRLSIIGAERERTAAAIGAYEAAQTALGQATAELRAAEAKAAEQLLALDTEHTKRLTAEAHAAKQLLAFETQSAERKAAEMLFIVAREDAEAQRDYLYSRLQATKQSLSWRLTRPARHLFHRSAHIARSGLQRCELESQPPSLVDRGGGLHSGC